MLVKFNPTTHCFEVNILVGNSLEAALALGEKSPSARRMGAPVRQPHPAALFDHRQKKPTIEGLALCQ